MADSIRLTDGCDCRLGGKASIGDRDNPIICSLDYPRWVALLAQNGIESQPSSSKGMRAQSRQRALALS